jgi:hypothetical protein
MVAMIMIRRILLVMFIITGGVISEAPAQDLSQPGLKMLTVEAGARPTGMGGAYTAVAGDPFSAAYNPAATIGIKKVTGSLGYNTHWENARIETGYLSFWKKGVVVTAGIQFAAVDNLEGRTGPTDDYFEFDFHDVSAKIGAAFELDSNYYIGFGLGMIYEKIDTYSGSAFNFDIGLFATPKENLNFGVAVTNFGSTMTLRNEAYDLPTAYRGGVSYKYKDILTSADIVSLNGDISVHVGGEYNIKRYFFVRGGYRFGYDSRDFSAGIGFTSRKLRIDYAFLPYKEGLDDSHLFNFTFEI